LQLKNCKPLLLKRPAGTAFVFILTVFFAASCAGKPELYERLSVYTVPENTELAVFAVLSGESRLAAMLENAFKADTQLKTLVSKTRTAEIYKSGTEDGKAYTVRLKGSYPLWLLKLNLCLSPVWKKDKKNDIYENSLNGIQLKAASSQMLVKTSASVNPDAAVLRLPEQGKLPDSRLVIYIKPELPEAYEAFNSAEIIFLFFDEKEKQLSGRAVLLTKGPAGHTEKLLRLFLFVNSRKGLLAELGIQASKLKISISGEKSIQLDGITVSYEELEKIIIKYSGGLIGEFK
jgi:hypothetical protein